MDYTTADLIGLVKEKETIPDSGAAYSDDVLLRYLDQALKAYIVPAIESTLEEHFVVTMDTEVPAFGNSGTNPPVNIPNTIQIPSESTGLRLRDVYIVGNDGTFFNLPRLTPTQAAGMGVGSGSAINNTWFSGANALYGGFYLQGNTIQIFPYGLASGKTIRITFQRAPGDLVLTSEAGLITNVTGDVIQIDKILSDWTSGLTRCALVQGEAPHDYVANANIPTTVYTTPAVLNDFTIVSIAGNVIVLPTGMGANVKVGDWICPRHSSVFAQNIPHALSPVLVQKAAEMCIHAAGDAEGTKVANMEYTMMMKMAMLQIAPRVIGKPAKVISSNSAFKASRSNSLGRW